MKRCPVCDRTYEDDTQSFCLDDGSVLSVAYDEVQTVVRGAEDTVLMYGATAGQRANQTVESVGRTPTPTPRSNSIVPHLIYAVAGLLGFIVIGVIVGGVLWFRAVDTAKNVNSPSNSNRNKSNVTVNPTPTVAIPSPTKELAAIAELGPRKENTSLDGTRITFYQSPEMVRCETDCKNNANCNGYTWIAAGTYNPGDSAMCYLMSSVISESPAKGHTSAVKRTP